MRSYTLEFATTTINLALLRKQLGELDAEQVVALANPIQCFAMLADFEARLGLDVNEARRALAEWHAQWPRRFGGWQAGDEGSTREGGRYRVISVEDDGHIQVKMTFIRYGEDDQPYEDRKFHAVVCFLNGQTHNDRGPKGSLDLLAPVARLERVT